MRAQEEIIAGRRPDEKGQSAHHRQIVSIFGLYGRSERGTLPVAAIIRLMQEVGAEPSSVRSSISRLKRKGVLVPVSVSGQRGYGLNPEVLKHFSIGDRRIFHPQPAALDDPWLLVAYSVPESARNIRHKLRNGLTRMGFGVVGPGLAIAPLQMRDELLEFVEIYEMQDYVEFFISHPDRSAVLERKVAQWWDLPALEAHYTAFLAQFEALGSKWVQGRGEESPDEAFRDYLPMFTAWRRLPYLDPGLPHEVLPPGWKGLVARDLFLRLRRTLEPLSREYTEAVIADRG